MSEVFVGGISCKPYRNMCIYIFSFGELSILRFDDDDVRVTRKISQRQNLFLSVKEIYSDCSERRDAYGIGGIDDELITALNLSTELYNDLRAVLERTG